MVGGLRGLGVAYVCASWTRTHARTRGEIGKLVLSLSELSFCLNPPDSVQLRQGIRLFVPGEVCLVIGQVRTKKERLSVGGGGANLEGGRSRRGQRREQDGAGWSRMERSSVLGLVWSGLGLVWSGLVSSDPGKKGDFKCKVGDFLGVRSTGGRTKRVPWSMLGNHGSSVPGPMRCVGLHGPVTPPPNVNQGQLTLPRYLLPTYLGK